MRLRRDQVGDRTGDRHSGAICKARADDDVAALDRALTFPGLPAHDGNRAVVQSMRLRREQVGDRTDLGLLHLRVGGKRFGSGGEGISPRISWTDEEVEALREGVAKHGKGAWKAVLVEKLARVPGQDHDGSQGQVAQLGVGGATIEQLRGNLTRGNSHVIQARRKHSIPCAETHRLLHAISTLTAVPMRPRGVRENLWSGATVGSL